MSDIVFSWQKVDREGKAVDEPQDKPGEGLWISSLKLPYVDDATMFYFAIDGNVWYPKYCVNGYQRDRALSFVLKEYARLRGL